MNIYERKDGRFESRIPNGKKADGKRSFLYILTAVYRLTSKLQHAGNSPLDDHRSPHR